MCPGPGRSQGGLWKATLPFPPVRLAPSCHTPQHTRNKLICNLRGKMMVALGLSRSTLPASLNSWLVSATGIDPHQFHLRAPTRNHFIVNQSFWKHLTKGPGFTNKPSIPAACWQHPANEECNQHLFKNYLFRFFRGWAVGGDVGMNWNFLIQARALMQGKLSPWKESHCVTKPSFKNKIN